MDLQDAKRDVYRPTMIRELKTPGNKGTQVVMKEAGSAPPPPPPPPPLAKDKLPSMTGDAIVGYEMTWSGGTFTGGVEPLTVVDQVRSTADGSNFNNLGDDKPYVVKAADLGLMLQAFSSATDADGTVVKSTSGLSSNVSRPVLDDYSFEVDGVAVAGGDTITLAPSASSVFEAKPEGNALYPPKDVTYSWTIRSGTGRFSGPTNAPVVIYIADALPGAALVQCTISSADANDAVAPALEILVTP